MSKFQFDDPDALAPFSVRLASEMGWTQAFTLGVIDEYRRFLYLTQVAGHPVTPSEEVDHVWHFHLAYTRSYWDEMCGRVLGKPLHHQPTKGGAQENQRFRTQYEQTLATYEREFGARPPRTIWPEPEVRFRQPLQQSVNLYTCAVIPRPRGGLALFVIALVGLAIFMPGRVPQPHRAIELVGAGAIAILLGFAYYATLGAGRYAGVVRKAGDTSGSSGCGSGCGGCG